MKYFLFMSIFWAAAWTALGQQSLYRRTAEASIEARIASARLVEAEHGDYCEFRLERAVILQRFEAHALPGEVYEASDIQNVRDYRAGSVAACDRLAGSSLREIVARNQYLEWSIKE